jgi:hypothetical protein
MPTAPDRRRIGRPFRRGGRQAVAVLSMTTVLALAGCGRTDPPVLPIVPTATASGMTSASGPATPGLTANPTGSPGSSTDAGTAGTAGPDGTDGTAGTAGPGTSGAPTGSLAPISCTSVTPIRVERSAVEPRRTTEVVTLVSDGRNLTPGTREQTDFTTPALTGPDATTTVTDEATLKKIADLVHGSSKNRVLLTRPQPPDAGADTNKRPFDATGTYVLYNASGLLSADVIADCSGQEQRWRFTAEADNTVGTVNCAVEPPRGNAVARQVYGAFC